MKFRKIAYMGLALLAFLAFSCRKEKIIPKSDLKALYIKMLLADQWIKENRKLSKVADTVYVYRPFLDSLGYTEEDFIRSVNHYLEDPASFADFFDDVSKTIRSRKSEIELSERGDFLRDSLEKARKRTPFRRPDFLSVEVPDSLYVRWFRIEEDSTGVQRFLLDSAIAVQTQEMPPVILDGREARESLDTMDDVPVRRIRDLAREVL